MGKPMLEIAYDVIVKHKKPVPFAKIWETVVLTRKFTPEQAEARVADFFSDMTLDDRFINIGDNKWDIKSRRKFEEVFIDADAIAVDDDDDDEEE